MGSETSTSDVLSCGGGFKVHGVQVGHFHRVILRGKDVHSSIFGRRVERVGTLVSIHDQNSLFCQKPRVMVKMRQTEDKERSHLVRPFNLFSFSTAGCVTEEQTVKLTHPDVDWKRSSTDVVIKRAAHFQQSSRCCFYPPDAALTAAVNQQSGSRTNQPAAGNYHSRPGTI